MDSSESASLSLAGKRSLSAVGDSAISYNICCSVVEAIIARNNAPNEVNTPHVAAWYSRICFILRQCSKLTRLHVSVESEDVGHASFSALGGLCG